MQGQMIAGKIIQTLCLVSGFGIKTVEYHVQKAQIKEQSEAITMLSKQHDSVTTPCEPIYLPCKHDTVSIVKYKEKIVKVNTKQSTEIKASGAAFYDSSKKGTFQPISYTNKKGVAVLDTNIEIKRNHPHADIRIK